MDYLPIFLDIRERPCLVVGSGEVAARKAQHQDNTTVIAVKVGDAAGAARHAGRRVEVPDDVVDAETVPVDLLAAVPGSAGLAEHHLKARAVPGRSLAVRAQATNVALLTSAMLIVLGIGALALWKAGGRGPEVQSGASSVMTPAGEGGARPAQQVDPQPEEARRPEPSRNRTNSSKSR